MKLGDAFPGNWLKSSDLGDEDHVVTIKDVRSEMIGQGAQAALKLVIEFRELAKALVCNKTNATAIAKLLHTEETDEWIGKKIILWVNPDVQFGGETVSAIRVRPKAPGGGGNAVLSLEQALDLCGSVGMDKEGLRHWLKAQGYTGWNPQRDSASLRKMVAGLAPAAPAGEDDIPF